MRTRVLAVLAVLAIVGCASTPTTPPIDWLAKTPTEIASATKTLDSEFDRNKSFMGPSVTISDGQVGMGPPLELYEERSVLLSALKTKATGSVSHIAIVTVSYLARDWRHYNTASFVDGLPPVTVTAKRTVNCLSAHACRYIEAVAIDLSEAALGDGQKPVRLRVNATNGKPLVINLPATYVRGFLMAVAANK